jgi:hypothetical protein
MILFIIQAHQMIFCEKIFDQNHNQAETYYKEFIQKAHTARRGNLL